MNLDTSTSDWNLPLAHELYYSTQFMHGGRTFVDIGAHVGTWTLRLAPLFERVIAFEPDPRAFKALQANVRAARLTNVTLMPCAVSNRTGQVELNLYENPSTNSMFGPADTLRHGETILETVEVDTVALDDLELEGVDFVKCDVEGAEMLVVEGAQKLFKEQRPDFWIECHGLFWKRLRKLLDPIECDVIDGGSRGLSLARHRESWPGLPPPQFRVYPHPTSPTAADYEELRRLHGLDCKAPLSGWLSEDYE